MGKAKILLAMLGVGVLALAVAVPALAWHPEGKIVKKVQNITAGSALADADDKNSAVSAKPGDTLKYVIEINNPAKPANNEWNHLYYTVLTDTLPEGVELVSNPAQRKIEENIGVIAPGAKVTREYLVKVKANVKDGVYIENKACFKGNSKVNDAPRDGCDVAITKVKVPEQPKPEVPKTPETPETPETPVTPEEPAAIPSTGPETLVATVIGLGAVAYAGTYAIRTKLVK